MVIHHEMHTLLYLSSTVSMCVCLSVFLCDATLCSFTLRTRMIIVLPSPPLSPPPRIETPEYPASVLRPVFVGMRCEVNGFYYCINHVYMPSI